MIFCHFGMRNPVAPFRPDGPEKGASRLTNFNYKLWTDNHQNAFAFHKNPIGRKIQSETGRKEKGSRFRFPDRASLTVCSGLE